MAAIWVASRHSPEDWMIDVFALGLIGLAIWGLWQSLGGTAWRLISGSVPDFRITSRPPDPRADLPSAIASRTVGHGAACGATGDGGGPADATCGDGGSSIAAGLLPGDGAFIGNQDAA